MTYNYQAQADLIHQTFGIPVTVYSFDGSAPIKSRPAELQHRPLSEIAWEISADWKNIYFGAVPYLDALYTLSQITDNYYEDSAEEVVRYFIANATGWKGDTARRIKAELKDILKGAN